jgi:hypothetical protein
MAFLSQGRYERILRAIEEVARLKVVKLKEEKRQKEYPVIYKLAQIKRNSLDGGLARKPLVACKECSFWCKRNNKNPIMWPITQEGKRCPLCHDCILIRIGIA